MSNTKSKGDLSHRVQQLEKRLAMVEETIKSVPYRQFSSSASGDFIRSNDLPNSLAKSLQAMQALGEADATMVSQKTQRNRSVETIYLNQLVRLGTLTRSRVGKKVFFRLAKVY